MRRILHFLVAAVIGVAVPPAVAGSTPEAPLDLIVSLDRPASPELARRLAALGPSWEARHIPVAAVRVPPARLDALRRLDGVRRLYPDRALRYHGRAVTATASPPVAPVLPGGVAPGPPGGFGAAKPVPGLGVTGKGVTVGVIDSGIDFTHPDLAPAMEANVKVGALGGSAPVEPVEGLPNTDTSSGHGTHVAGDVAGRGTASDGAYQGSAPEASLVGIGAGEGATVFSRAILQAYDWVLEHHREYGIRVVNNSFGGSFEPFDPDAPINRATRAAADAGIVVVFAQGNDGDELTMNSNATAPWVIAVAAGTQAGGLTDFTSGGLDADVLDHASFNVDDRVGDPRRPLRMGLYHPSVVALGEYVVGPRAAGTILPLAGARHDLALPPGDQVHYTIMSGTSMAAPSAAGIVALLLEANPALGPADVKRVLQITARPIPGVPFFRQGYGTADPAAAVGLARRLAGEGREAVDRILDERQGARDGGILAGMPRPRRTTAWWADGTTTRNTRSRRITVVSGTGRLKVVNAGFSLPVVPDPAQAIIVRDAAGQVVGRSESRSPGESGTIVLDLDLTKLTGLSWGSWTIEVSEGVGLPAGIFGPQQATVAATFAEPAKAEPISSMLPSSVLASGGPAVPGGRR